MNGFIESGVTADYAYDENGNLTYDPDKEITITYNYLNLPQTIQKTNGDLITFTYSAAGTKLRRVATMGSTNMTYDYVSGIEYYDGEIEATYGNGYRIYNEENGNGTVNWVYEYYLSDHLGNTRVTFTDDAGLAVIQQTNDYYPFGMKMHGEHSTMQTSNNRYLYNNKELIADLDIGLYDYGARFYDPSVGRFLQIDPLSERNAFQSPFVYADNNPISNIDLFGMDAASQEDMDRFEKAKSLGTTIYSSESSKWPPAEGKAGQSHFDGDGSFTHDGKGWKDIGNGSYILSTVVVNGKASSSNKSSTSSNVREQKGPTSDNYAGMSGALTAFGMTATVSSRVIDGNWLSLTNASKYDLFGKRIIGGFSVTSAGISTVDYTTNHLMKGGSIWSPQSLLVAGDLALTKYSVKNPVRGLILTGAWEAGKAAGRYKNYLEVKYSDRGLDGLLTTPYR